MLVDGIAVTASAYEDTQNILHDRYADKDRIIQAYLFYLEEVAPIQFVSAEALNTTYIEFNRRIQALPALGEDVNECIVREDSPRISGRYLPTLDYAGELRGSFRKKILR